MEISKMFKRVTTVLALGALGVLGGDSAEAAMPLSAITQNLNVSVAVTGSCTMTAPAAISLASWTYGAPASNTGTSNFNVTCSTGLPYELTTTGGNAGVVGVTDRRDFGAGGFRANYGVADCIYYDLTATGTNPRSGSGAAQAVTVTFTPSGVFCAGGTEPVAGTYTDTVAIYAAY